MNEWATWGANDRHSHAYSSLLSKQAETIAKNLRIAEAFRDIRCLACHTGMPLDALELEQGHASVVSDTQSQDARLQSGVECEGCHGASHQTIGIAESQGWKDAHYSEDWRYLLESDKWEKFGFYDLKSPIQKTKLCLSCHQGNIQTGRLITPAMYKAGHPLLPKFEIESFLTQMPSHWRSLDEKPASVRDEWFKKTGKVFDPQEHTRSKRLLVGALISLSEQLALVADLCDSKVPSPLPRPTWVEFAPLVLPNQRFELLKDSFQAEGILRCSDSLWSTAMAEIACEFAEIRAEEFRERINHVLTAMETGLSGKLSPLIESCRETSAWLEFVASQLDQRRFTENHASRMLWRVSEAGAAGFRL